MESFTTREVARLLGLSPTQVRSQAKAGFLTPDRGPRNDYRFSFQDLVMLRTARELARARVPPHRIRSALRGLAQQLPAGRSLSEIRITAEGQRILVSEGGSAWNPESGQLQIDFTAREAPSHLRPSTTRLTAPASSDPEATATASDWYDRAMSLEPDSPDEACHAYARALAVDASFSAAHVNLGRLLQLAGRINDAIEHYRLALQQQNADPAAAFNLGTALEELGRWGEALTGYRRALQLDPEYADAHFNLARLYEQLGRPAAALRHLRTYHWLKRS
jgi:tetratricopeptide (TPR) repeat protein